MSYFLNRSFLSFLKLLIIAMYQLMMYVKKQRIYLWNDLWFLKSVNSRSSNRAGCITRLLQSCRHEITRCIHTRAAWRHARRRVVVGSTGMPLLLLDHFRFSVCHSPFAAFQYRIAGIRDRVCPRIFSKNIRDYHYLYNIFLSKTYVISHEFLSTCEKIVCELNRLDVVLILKRYEQNMYDNF